MGFHTRLEQHHYVTLPFGIGKNQLDKAAYAFLDFLTLPEEVLRSLHLPSPYENGTADGYTDKRNSGGHDKKRYFHWSRALKDKLAYNAVARRYPNAAHFFKEASIIYDEAEHVAVKTFERCFPEHVVKRVVVDGKIASAALRFLAYDPNAGDFSAKAHYDKCTGTLALAESSPGLRIGCCDQHPLKQVEHHDGTCIFMPGKLLHEDMSGAVTPAWHDVVHHRDVPSVRVGCARWSIVFFINDKDGRFPSYKTAHTPIH